MTYIVRHLFAILGLPCAVVVAMPHWILTSWAALDTRWGDITILEWLPRSLGVAVFSCGLALFSWCVTLFMRVGRGTLAPWDPTKKLVIVGPYRSVRNPMISGVAMMLWGQGLFWGSILLIGWATAFVAVNHVYFVKAEEPGRERRFGEEYRIYRENVPRWIPRPASQPNLS